MTDDHESNRARVRRLLFAPLGFRWPRTMPEDDGRARLNALADELAYLTDSDLAVLTGMLRVHGQGSAKNFWPDRATFIGYAHLVRPLPLDADPKLRSWFASVEGPRALAEGTLVETWQYFETKRVPPATPQARAMVARKAAENSRRVTYIRDQIKREVRPAPDDAKFLSWYEAQTKALSALVRDLRQAKGCDDAA